LGLLALAIYPAMVHQSVEPLSYLPAAALLLALLSRIQCYLDVRKRGLLWKAGLLLGLLILFRPSAALFLVALPPLLLLRRKKFMPGIVLVLFAGLVVGAWIGFASQQTDRWVPINDANSRNFYLGNNHWTSDYYTWYYGSHWTGDPALPAEFRHQLDSLEKLPEAVRGRAFMRAGWQEIKAEPARFGWRTLARMRTLLAFDTFAGTRAMKADGPEKYYWGKGVLALDGLVYLSVLLLSVAFLFSTARRELAGRDIALVTGFLTVYSIPYWLSFSHPTYHLPMVPLMLLLAVVWAQIALRQESKMPKFRNKWLGWLVLIVLIAIQVEWVVMMIYKSLVFLD
jgi:4-amino-4-deoxy-L-arabinose transferase-like glycosyltransferase